MAIGQQVSIMRGSVDVAAGPSGSPSTNYKTGNGPGTDFSQFQLGNINPTDVVTLTDVYLTTSESGGCTVTAAETQVRIFPTSNPSAANSAAFAYTSPQRVCPDWRASLPACNTGDREFGSGANSSRSFGVANYDGLGVIALEVTWSITATTGGCAPVSITETAFFTVGSAPLPVELTSISARESGDRNVVEWVVASEEDLLTYTLERTTSAVDATSSFTSVTDVAPRGVQEGIEAVYSAYDQSPARVSYYRVKAVDLDGSIEYSPVVAVTRAGAGSGVKVYPNPAQVGAFAMLEFDEAPIDGSVTVTDLAGRVMLVTQVSGSTKVELPTAGLAAGVYNVNLSDATGILQTSQLVVK